MYVSASTIASGISIHEWMYLLPIELHARFAVKTAGNRQPATGNRQLTCHYENHNSINLCNSQHQRNRQQHIFYPATSIIAFVFADQQILSSKLGNTTAFYIYSLLPPTINLYLLCLKLYFKIFYNKFRLAYNAN